jgi:hypothetical protein
VFEQGHLRQQLDDSESLGSARKSVWRVVVVKVGWGGGMGGDFDRLPIRHESHAGWAQNDGHEQPLPRPFGVKARGVSIRSRRFGAKKLGAPEVCV